MNPTRLRALLIIGIAVVLIAPVTGLEVWSTVELSCSAGPTLAIDSHSLTPYLLLNSPYLGQANGSFVVWNNSSNPRTWWGLGLVAENGSGWAAFEDFRWTITRMGAKAPGAVCNPQFAARGLDLNGGGVNPLGQNLTNDSAEPNSSGYFGTTTSYSLLYYNNSFSRSSFVVSTCGGPTQVKHLTSHHVDIGIPFTYDGKVVVAQASVSIFSSYNYTFPADAGQWQADNLSAPGGPGGGWAFSYSPCP